MNLFYASTPRKIALAQIAVAALFVALNFEALAQQTKYPSVQSQNTMTATQTMEISGMFKVNQETRLLDDVYLEKLKDLAAPATQDRLMLIDKFGKMKGGPPFESIPPGQGGGGNGGGGNPNPQSCSNTFEWEKISGTSNIYNCGFGNVGIGIPAPESLLHVRKPGYPSSSFPGSQGALFKVQQSDNTDWAAEIYNNGGGGKGLLIIADGASSDVPALKTQNISGDVGLAVNSDGRVGIGTVSPSQKLQVNGNIKINDYYDLLLRNSHHGLGWYGNPFSENKRFVLTNQSENIDGPVLYGFSGGALGSKYFYGDGQGGNIEAQNIALRWTQDGRVGIGTSDPLAKINIKDGSIRIDNQTPNWNTWKIAIETPQGSIWKTTEVSTLTGKYHGFGLTTTGWYWSISDANCIKYPMRLELDVNKKPTLIVEETSWCDFVYDENYKRPTFEEQENYWEKYKHLYGVASEKDIIKNGLDITGTMKGFALNIEEVRMDAVDLHKRLLVSEQKNTELQEKIDGQQKQIDELKKAILNLKENK